MQMSIADGASKTSSSNKGGAKRLVVVSSSVPDIDQFCKTLKNDGSIVVVRTDFGRDNAFTIHTAMVEAMGGKRVDSIAFVDHGKPNTMLLTNTLKLNTTTWVRNTRGVKDFMISSAREFLSEKGRIDFLTCSFTKKSGNVSLCCMPCRLNLLDMMERETGIDFAASGTGMHIFTFHEHSIRPRARAVFLSLLNLPHTIIVSLDTQTRTASHTSIRKSSERRISRRKLHS